MTYDLRNIPEQVRAHSIVLGVPVASMHVSGTAALAMHGLMDMTPAIVVEVDADTFEDLCNRFQNGQLLPDDTNTNNILSINSSIRVMVGDPGKDVNVIEGITVLTKSELLDTYMRLYEVSVLGKERIEQIASYRDRLIRSINIDDMKKPLEVPAARDLFVKFAAFMPHFERLKRFALSAMPPGQHFMFAGEDGVVWFAMLINESTSGRNVRWLQLYQTDADAKKFFSDLQGQPLAMKHWNSELIFETIV